MTLKPGLYKIRFVPACVQPPFLGGLYATATELGSPVLAEPEKPGVGLQTWEVHLNKNGKYIITQPGFQSKFAGIGPVLAGWSLAQLADERPTGNILFNVNYVELDISPFAEGKNEVYSVAVPNPKGLVGVQFFVTERDQVLVSLPFVAGVRYPPPHPHWEFIPAERK